MESQEEEDEEEEERGRSRGPIHKKPTIRKTDIDVVEVLNFRTNRDQLIIIQLTEMNDSDTSGIIVTSNSVT